MTPQGRPLPPTSSLPPLSTLPALSEGKLLAALDSLTALYRPLLGTSLALAGASADMVPGSKKDPPPPHPHDPADSGYVSATETEDEDDDNPATCPRGEALASIRADSFERAHAERWLTGLLGRAATLPCLADDGDLLNRVLDLASGILDSFYAAPLDEEEARLEEAASFTRTFSFEPPPALDREEKKTTSSSSPSSPSSPIQVHLNDGLAGTDSSDPDDVGLQSWGAAVILSELLCSDPSHFGLTRLPTSSPRIIELGAGTGLVSLVLAHLLPRLGVTGDSTTIIATDYHPSVLANLGANVEANFPPQKDEKPHPAAPLVAPLDWASPLDAESPPFRHLGGADMLVATDVVYAPEHARWLRDCASRLLAPHGIFWLLVTVRRAGRFQDLRVAETVEAVFSGEGDAGRDCRRDPVGRRLAILHSETLEKRRGVGRGDESDYRLFSIGWA
ncbi:hypothetical protein SODALDRAFT_334314 [Sodiomyces alkalinus F11]|uniref:S-adenosyl-L-methionine-dependent methyltransferase n=1 Tax=Sodiomyces alkalinus (strain CBS 110278 / VKM F-3762 / F11) TaxID=1314773 RepID=A0A3N2PRZ2_SODAK|nr:hypothetical protein SODALDRAFT_334314 [Sodiomyces alkalinus F11]ROT37230.1 hypothetical protein SODALDRAFT_334314 [Sodiomyces alkalinus F11]